VLCSSRNHHFIIDGPSQNGCPGEALTPVEAFLAGIAACGVELVEVIGRETERNVASVHVSIRGVVDRSQPVRRDFTVFNRVSMSFTIGGVDRAAAEDLVEKFKGR
jgi:uncharacterized OsmC-like protein